MICSLPTFTFLFLIPNIFSLDVIPGDAYKVEKSGDENSGFVTKVVFTDKNEDKDEKIDGDTKKSAKKDKKKKVKEAINGKPAAAKDSFESKEETPTLTKKERQKIKRKRKREEAKERKRLKRESGEVEGQSDDTKKKIASNKKIPAVPVKSVNESKQDNKNKEDESTALQQITALQTSWSIQTSITLHETLATGLHKLQYTYPTPIQAATLPAAVLGRRDIVGAAPTGSGKTLSYGLPILQYLLDNVDDVPSNTPVDGNNKKSLFQKQPLQALILTPTRELAIQVTNELTTVSINTIKIGTIVGGFAEVKQRRTLERIRPSVIVATPGRLWELVSCFFLMYVALCF